MKKSCNELLTEFKTRTGIFQSEKLNFKFNHKKDIYNITAPFLVNNEKIIAARVEDRESENSQVIFFKEINNTFMIKENFPILNLQDPFICRIKDEMVLGGVETYPHPEKKGELGYKTAFFRGKTLDKLQKFAYGPEMMKDIRLLEVSNEKILVATRPQGEIGGRGKIGYIIIESLEDLNPENILKASILENLFYDDEWGGVNELHLLNNGLIGALSHIAKFDELGNRHYYSSAFTLNIENGHYSSMKIIATKDNFNENEYKREDLKDVIFSGGLIRMKNNLAELYCGVCDVSAHKILINDPFLEYEF